MRDGRLHTKRSIDARADPPVSDWNGSRSLDYAQPFGDDGEAFRFDIPRLVLGVQRLKPNASVLPLVALLALLAVVALDSVARRLIGHAEAFHQHDLPLA